MKSIQVLLAGVMTACLWASSVPAAEPAFDCAKAESSAEKLICSNDELAALDRDLANVYGEAVDAVRSLDAGADEALDELKTYQRGWVKGRDECWKSDDMLSCLRAIYQYRVAELTARYQLIKGQAPVFYTCNGKPEDEIVATFFPTDPPSARLERGDTTEVVVEGPTGSGARYEGNFGLVFWVKGNEAMVEWPEGTSFNCEARG